MTCNNGENYLPGALVRIKERVRIKTKTVRPHKSPQKAYEKKNPIYQAMCRYTHVSDIFRIGEPARTAFDMAKYNP